MIPDILERRWYHSYIFTVTKKIPRDSYRKYSIRI